MTSKNCENPRRENPYVYAKVIKKRVKIGKVEDSILVHLFDQPVINQSDNKMTTVMLGDETQNFDYVL